MRCWEPAVEIPGGEDKRELLAVEIPGGEDKGGELMIRLVTPGEVQDPLPMVLYRGTSGWHCYMGDQIMSEDQQIYMDICSHPGCGSLPTTFTSTQVTHPSPRIIRCSGRRLTRCMHGRMAVYPHHRGWRKLPTYMTEVLITSVFPSSLRFGESWISPQKGAARHYAVLTMACRPPFYNRP